MWTWQKFRISCARTCADTHTIRVTRVQQNILKERTWKGLQDSWLRQCLRTKIKVKWWENKSCAKAKISLNFSSNAHNFLADHPKAHRTRWKTYQRLKSQFYDSWSNEICRSLLNRNSGELIIKNTFYRVEWNEKAKKMLFTIQHNKKPLRRNLVTLKCKSSDAFFPLKIYVSLI